MHLVEAEMPCDDCGKNTMQSLVFHWSADMCACTDKTACKQRFDDADDDDFDHGCTELLNMCGVCFATTGLDEDG